MHARTPLPVVIDDESILVAYLPEGAEGSLLVLRHFESIHGSDGVHHSLALLEECRIHRTIRRIEEPIVEQVVLVPLV